MFNTDLVVTVAQAEGSQGREIAEDLAQRLQLTYVDEAVIKLATENLDHSKVESYLQELARRGRVIMVNCGANFFLHDFSGVVNLLIEAPLGCRIERVMHTQHLARSSAEHRICQLDGQYAAQIRAFYGPDWTSPDLYDLALNTERLTNDEALETLSNFINMFQQNHPQVIPQLQPGIYSQSTPEDDLAERYQQIVDLLHK